MANEDKKDFNAMLHDNKDMPKFQIITDQKSIEKYGGSKMYFAPPIDYDRVMKKVPYGKVITVGTIREYFAELSGADFTEPITAGIFVSIVAWASYQRSEDETPYWRTLKANGERHIADIENIGKHPSFQLFHDLVTMFNISVDEYFYPAKNIEKSTTRRQIDSSLDLLSDNELKIIQGTIDGILNSRENKK